MEHGQFAVAWWETIPFISLLLIIAVFPLFKKTEHFWESNKNKLFIALSLGLLVTAWLLLNDQWSAIQHSLIEYVQFIILLAALYIISGNIFLKGDIQATPRNNMLFLSVGAIMASFIGTTGAAMLLIRPILNTNQERKFVVHTVIFAILIVANCGGLLTPLGDPPLFLGFIKGVPFDWTFGLFIEWLFVNSSLLIIYWLFDSYIYHSKESSQAKIFDKDNIVKLQLVGKINLLWLLGIVLSVAFIPSIDLSVMHGGHAPWQVYIPFREIVMLFLTGLSLSWSQQARQDNQFNYHAIQEVAALFIGIFLTMIPALMWLKQIAPYLPVNELSLFYMTGGLSAFLDNAPTYLNFLALGMSSVNLDIDSKADVLKFALEYPDLLKAISTGAVFCGAITYIGNGPNFMVKAIAENRGVKMPSFGGYMGWSMAILVPILVVLVFFVM